VFPAANRLAQPWGADQRQLYVDAYLEMATRTMLAMVDAAAAPGRAGVAIVFNPAGGGAFLRGLGQPLEAEISALIPALLTAAFAQSRRLRPNVPTRLILVGMRQHASTALPRWGLDHINKTLALRGSRRYEDLHVREFVSAEGGDMLAIARRELALTSGTWAVAVSMAADSRRLGNYYLALAHHGHELVKNADPFNGARRASDENNTRRTTMLDVALAFNALALSDAAGERTLTVPHACDADSAAMTLRAATLALRVRGVPWDDRTACVSEHRGDRDDKTPNRLDVCLYDMLAVKIAHEDSPDVHETLQLLAANDTIGEFQLQPAALVAGATAQQQQEEEAAVATPPAALC
jgi:hypothetical protein